MNTPASLLPFGGCVGTPTNCVYIGTYDTICVLYK